MVSRNGVVNYYIFALFMVVFSANFGVNSGHLRTLFVEEVCYATGRGSINLSIQKSVILSSVPSGEQDCRILVQTERSSSLVVSFNRYHLFENDSLTFSDRHGFKLALQGEAYYVDERKSLILEGPVNIHYFTQHNRPDTKLKFQIVLTQVHDGPCEVDEYKCQNNKCIEKRLACTQHNHCGDLTSSDKCSPGGFIQEVTSPTVTSKISPFLIAIAVSGVILFIVVIVFVVGVIRTCQNKNKSPKPNTLPTTLPTTVPTTLPTVAAGVEPPRPQQASVFNRLRQSFRGMRQPTAPPPDSGAQHSESCEVPSMYPKLPSDGVDNPDFKHDE